MMELQAIEVGSRPATWVVVAHRSGARLFKSIGERISLVREFDYPDGRRQNREIDSDSKGSRSSPASGRPAGSMIHGGLDAQTEAAEHVSEVFAKDVAEHIRMGRTHHEFDDLVLVAEPGFLGKIKKFLDKTTAKNLVGTINRNLAHLPEHELIPQLAAILAARRVA